MPENYLELWNVHFDSDGFSYTYTTSAKLIQAVETFTDLQISDGVGIETKDEAIKQIISNVETHLVDSETEQMFVIMIGEARVQIKKLILDEQNPVVKALISAFPQVDEKTQKSINNLLTNPLSA